MMIGERLLVVDDDESNRVTLAALLESEGYVVDESADCDDALRRIAQSNYAAVILDWRLGTRSGAELVAPIRTHQPAARILVVTGSDTLDAHTIGVDAIGTKGESFETTLHRLRTA
jgi:two-component system response regulator RegA